MSLTPTPIPQIPVRVRFPNRYTGGYDSSTVTDKLRWQTIRSVKNARLTANSNMGGETVVGYKVYPCVCPPPVLNPCDFSKAAAFQSKNTIPTYSCSDPSGRCVVIGFWNNNPVTIKDGSGSVVGSLSGSVDGTSGFLSVFDASGNCDWSAKMEGPRLTILNVISDSAGNITCVGIHGEGSMVAYSSSGLQTLSPLNNGSYNIFIVQYSPDGSLNWCSNMSSTYGSGYSFIPSDLVIGADSAIYLGFITSVPSFQIYNSDNTQWNGPIACSTQFGSILGISSSGFVMWNTNIESYSWSCTLCYTGSAILVSSFILESPFLIQDQSGNSVTFPFPSLYPSQSSYSKSTAVAQLSLGGVPVWGTVVANSLFDSNSNIPGAVVALSTTPRYIKSVVRGGYYIGSIDLNGNNISFYDTDGVTRVSLPMSSDSANGGSFLVSMSSSGYTSWVTQILGYKAQLYGLLSVADGLCMTGISFADPSLNPVNFYNAGNTTTPSLSLPTGSGFIAKYGFNGAILWARQIDAPPYNTPFSLVNDSFGNICIQCTASGTFRFYNEGGDVVKTIVLGEGVRYQVVAKYSNDGTFLWAGYVGGCTSAISSWMVAGTCGDIYTSGYVNILDSNPCVVYDASGSPLFQFPDQASYNTVTVHWI